MKKNILFFFIFILFLICCLEIALSRLIIKPLFYKIHVAPHGSSVYALSNNKNLLYTPLPGTDGFNEHGYRGRSFPLEKAKGKKRIVFIGDSVLFGVSVPLEKIFTELLNNQLSSSHEIINFGVPGYSIIQGFEYLRQHGVKFQPDIVFFTISFNDLQTLGSDVLRAFNRRLSKMKNHKLYKNYYLYANKFDNFMLNFSIYSLLKMKLSKPKTNNVFNDGVIDDHTIDKLLWRMKSWINKTGIEIIYIFFPGPINVYSKQPPRYIYEANIPLMKKLKDKMVALNFSILDFDDYLLDSEYKENRNKLFLDHIHFSEKGHKSVSKFLFEFITNKTVLQK